jgi:hypothetical protein
MIRTASRGIAVMLRDAHLEGKEKSVCNGILFKLPEAGHPYFSVW